MKTMRFLALALTLLTVNVVFAADEIHWTFTGQNSVTFDWRGTTTEKTIGYGLTSGVYTQVTATTPNPVPVSSSGPFWEANLTGLTANTRYYYKIGNEPERSFRTPPAPGSSNFNVYAEGNIGSSSKYFNTGVIQDIIATGLPSFVVGLGDLTLGSINGKATIDQHFNDVMVWSKEAAYMPVWGDRDTISSRKESFKNYKGRFAVPNPQTSPGSPLAGGEDWYWFDYGNIRFITLPEPWTGAWEDWNTKAGALMAQAQADPNIKFIVTFVHRPAYSSGHYTGSSTLKGMLDALGDTYSKYQLNINAHSNNYERSLPQHGVIHVTAGTGGADLTQDGTCLWLTCTKPSWSAFRAMHLGALKLSFTNSSIVGSFICGPAGGGTNDVTCTKGSVIDSFMIGDTQAPSVPTNVNATASSTTQINLSWSASTDNIGVTGYKVYRNGSQIGTASSTTYNDSGLSPSTSYTYTVAAFDAAGNTSALSTATTTTATGVATSSCAPAPTSSLVVNVKDKGATGNGVTNDTAAIQAAINQVGGTGGTVLVPDGTYMIDALTSLKMGSNMTFSMSSNSVLRAIPNASETSAIILINRSSNVNVVGGTVQGERANHQGITGEWGMGIQLLLSNNVVVERVTSKDNWGDGFYIGLTTNNSTFCSVIADNNRRQGMSVTSADGLVVRDSIFKNTNGAAPMAGIDIEPNSGLTVKNVQILNSQMFNNKGSGIALINQSAYITNVTIDRNSVSNNGVVNVGSHALLLVGTSGHKITNNIVSNNLHNGIVLTYGSSNNTATSNTANNNGNSDSLQDGIGILMYAGSTNNTITYNTATGNLISNITDDVGGNIISSNTAP